MITGLEYRIIPHEKQRYDTGGDWWIDPDGTLQIRVSDLGDWRFSFLVFLHELVEVALCAVRGITTEQVDAFDVAWTPHGDMEEPGDDPACPCYKEHQFAIMVEESVGRVMGVDLDKYYASYHRLPPHPSGHVGFVRKTGP